MSETITVAYSRGRRVETSPAYQYDSNVLLRFDGEPEGCTCTFWTWESEESLTVAEVGGAFTVPNSLLAGTDRIHASLDGNDGDSTLGLMEAVIPMVGREKPTAYVKTDDENVISAGTLVSQCQAYRDETKALSDEFPAATLSNRIDLMDAAKVPWPTDDKYGTDGQALRTNADGTTSWATLGQPTDAQTLAAVDTWLTAHPEATTTVQDHSLTYEKLVNGTLGYVTPEMYGAVGDGVTDDSDAINAALLASSHVLLGPKTYRIEKPIRMQSDTELCGCGAKTVLDNHAGEPSGTPGAYKTVIQMGDSMAPSESLNRTSDLGDDSYKYFVGGYDDVAFTILASQTYAYDTSSSRTMLSRSSIACDTDMEVGEVLLFSNGLKMTGSGGSPSAEALRAFQRYSQVAIITDKTEDVDFDALAYPVYDADGNAVTGTHTAYALSSGIPEPITEDTYSASSDTSAQKASVTPGTIYMYRYANVEGKSLPGQGSEQAAGITRPLWMCNHAHVHDMTLRQNPRTGNTYYGVFVNGCLNHVHDLYVDGMCAVAANASERNHVHDIDVTSYMAAMDNAELVYNSTFERITVRETLPRSETKNHQLAVGRGRGNAYRSLDIGTTLTIAASYASCLLADCRFAHSAQLTTTAAHSDVAVERCSFGGTLTALRNTRFSDCSFEALVYTRTDLSCTFERCEAASFPAPSSGTNYASMSVHMDGWKSAMLGKSAWNLSVASGATKTLTLDTTFDGLCVTEVAFDGTIACSVVNLTTITSPLTFINMGGTVRVIDGAGRNHSWKSGADKSAVPITITGATYGCVTQRSLID